MRERLGEGDSSLNAIIAAMSLFSSKREKRLWLWALAAVIALYSTLGLAGALAGRLL